MFKWFKKESDVKTLEKELAVIATKINKHEAHVSSLRSTARRLKGVVTLYGLMLYAIYFAIWIMFYMKSRHDKRAWILHALPIFFVPLAIYVVRVGLSSFYTRRISNEEGNLETLKSTQKEKIEEFKNKTDFYTTKSLIDRYSGESTTSSAPTTPTATRKNQAAHLTSSASSVRQSPRLQTQSQLTPQKVSPQSLKGTIPTPHTLSGLVQNDEPPSAEFAPNAEASIHVPSVTHWYDRILDVIIGEDEANEHSRYQLEQKLRAKDEKISAMELELMKLRQAAQPEPTASIDDSKTDLGSSSIDQESKKTIRTRKSARTKAGASSDDDE